MNIKKLNEELDRILNESLNEAEEAIPLQQRWEEEMIALPIIETAEGEVYFQPSEDGKYIEYGSMTNGGLNVEGRIEYEPDKSLDYHIQGLADELFEKYGYPEMDESTQKNEA